MNKLINGTIWWIFSSLCVLIGLYPVLYFIIDRRFGLLSSKTEELLTNQIWNVGFYGHIILGGIALLIGWTQFSAKLRRKRIKLHRTIGKIYIFSVFISGICGIYIAQFATGGVSNVIGFSLSGLVWLATTFLAYNAIKRGSIEQHQNNMLYSYAVCFSAVTLRFWLPLFTYILGEFESAYLVVSWVSWIPNLIVAFYIIKRRKIKPATSNLKK